MGHGDFARRGGQVGDEKARAGGEEVRGHGPLGLGHVGRTDPMSSAVVKDYLTPAPNDDAIRKPLPFNLLYGVCQCCTCFKLGNFLCFNLNRPARLWIAPGACCTSRSIGEHTDFFLT